MTPDGENAGGLDQAIRLFEGSLEQGHRTYDLMEEMLAKETGRSAGPVIAAQNTLQAYKDAQHCFGEIADDAAYIKAKGPEAPGLAMTITDALAHIRAELETFLEPSSGHGERIDLAKIVGKYIGETEKAWASLKAL